MTGRLSAAVILSAGPAIANSVTGLLVAHDNDWPLLVIGGCRPIDMRGRGAFQDLDAVPIVGSITRFAARLDRPEEIVPALDRACRIATGSRPRGGRARGHAADAGAAPGAARRRSAALVRAVRRAVATRRSARPPVRRVPCRAGLSP
jgi:TPP-dependent trihydroxycyclohexane-1,2-dione (THcHDO) dehydratase